VARLKRAGLCAAPSSSSGVDPGANMEYLKNVGFLK